MKKKITKSKVLKKIAEIPGITEIGVSMGEGTPTIHIDPNDKIENARLYSKTVILSRIKKHLEEAQKAAPKKVKAKSGGCSDVEACIQCGAAIYAIISKLF